MARVRANGIEIEYEAVGDAGSPTILLVMGLGAQLVRWPAALIDTLADRGYRVVSFDNRDVGLSTKFDAAGRPNLWWMAAAHMVGRPLPAPYTLSDMACDAVGLLDALDIPAAHVVGASMGGMIAQLVAAEHPDRTLSLASIMSTTGNPRLPGATARATGMLLRRPRSDALDDIVAHGVLAAKVIGSPGYPIDDAVLAARVRAEVERNHYPAGTLRQMAAILADGDRRARLRRIVAPTVVIHGTDDPLVHISGGRDTAAAIPGATMVEIAGMGHTIPPPLVAPIADAIDRNARRTVPLAQAA